WRASGTIAWRSILKPGGSLTFFRFSRIAFAFWPPCGTTGMLRSVDATLNCLRVARLSGRWAATGAAAITADIARTMVETLTRMGSSFARAFAQVRRERSRRDPVSVRDASRVNECAREVATGN